MDTVIKTFCVYFILLLLLRLSGRRTLAQMTPFDLIVVLIIGGTTQRALLGQDYSVTNALLVVVTLLVIDIALSLVECHFPRVGKILNGMPMIVVEQGRLLRERMHRARLTEDDVLSAARRHGLDRLLDIKFAILEASGEISIIPYPARNHAAQAQVL